MRKAFLILSILLVASMSEAQSNKFYLNPILAGFYPDPSICRAGDDYYIVTSSFAFFPGLPIFHSKDLVSWKQLGHAMDRPEQLELSGAGVSRGLFAPAISYHNGTFYIVCTLIDKGGNFVITAKDPAGPWSNPVWLKNVDGIDPSIFFDKTDKAYIVYNSVPPDNKTLWNGHRTIRMREFDYKNLQADDREKLLINGGTDTSKHPVWIEGPHLYNIDGWYYLMCAEGGTAYNHSEVVFRSRSVEGPFTSYEGNPILTQRHLNPSRENPITTTGHADLVQTPEGSWHAVFLGCRPYEGNHFNTGRETFMAPVTWKDGWPIINYGNEEVQYRYPVSSSMKEPHQNAFSGNVSFHDDFKSKVPGPRWIFLRTPKEKWFAAKSAAGGLTIDVRPQTIAGRENPSFLGVRQQNIKFTAVTSLSFQPKNGNEKAGLVIFQNEDHFYYLCRSVENNRPVVQLYKSILLPPDQNRMELLRTLPLGSDKGGALYLKMESSGASISFFFSQDNKNWTAVGGNLDAKFLSTETAGGFVGCTISLYATSLGNPSSGAATFHWFDYKGNDDIYK